MGITRYFLPALVGGLIAGVLSLIPIVNFLNYLCCMWVIVGGVISSWLLLRRGGVSPDARLKQGATAGAFAGVVAALIELILIAVISLVFGAAFFLPFLAILGLGGGRAAPLIIFPIAITGVTFFIVIAIAGLILLMIHIFFATLGGGLYAAFSKGRAPSPAPASSKAREEERAEEEEVAEAQAKGKKVAKGRKKATA